jgi:hypothetical protein
METLCIPIKRLAHSHDYPLVFFEDIPEAYREAMKQACIGSATLDKRGAYTHDIKKHFSRIGIIVTFTETNT